MSRVAPSDGPPPSYNPDPYGASKNAGAATVTGQPQPQQSPYHGRDGASLIPAVQEKLAANGISTDAVKGWYTIPDEFHEKIARQGCMPYACCPCILVICWPCALCTYLSTKATLPTVAHVVTKNDIIFFAEPSGPCPGCYSGGKDAKVTPLKLIQSVAADNAETGLLACCAGCCAVPKIDITLSTMHSTGGKHPQMVNDKLSIYTEDPALGATWFREMMQNQEDHPHDVNVVTSVAGNGAAPNDDIPAQIHKLGTLRDQGLLTDAEYDSKKTELLARM